MSDTMNDTIPPKILGRWERAKTVLEGRGFVVLPLGEICPVGLQWEGWDLTDDDDWRDVLSREHFGWAPSVYDHRSGKCVYWHRNGR